jgi:hypothetical protein
VKLEHLFILATLVIVLNHWNMVVHHYDDVDSGESSEIAPALRSATFKECAEEERNVAGCEWSERLSREVGVHFALLDYPK